MKEDKALRAPHIILMTRRFNEVGLGFFLPFSRNGNLKFICILRVFIQFSKGSQLVVSEIIRRTNMSARVNAIEKWTAVADIARCLRNYNGVLQICAAFTTSSVYRLKKTWEKVSKSVRFLFTASVLAVAKTITSYRFNFADETNYQEIATDCVFRWSISEPAWYVAPFRTSLYTILGYVSVRSIFHRRRNTQFHGWGFTKFF